MDSITRSSWGSSSHEFAIIPRRGRGDGGGAVELSAERAESGTAKTRKEEPGNCRVQTDERK